MPTTTLDATRPATRPRPAKASGRRKELRAFEASYAFTPQQFRAWANLTEAQRRAIDSGQIVPCIIYPDDFDRRLFTEDELAEMKARCDNCPVLDRCQEYKESGVIVTGFLAGTACERVH